MSRNFYLLLILMLFQSCTKEKFLKSSTSKSAETTERILQYKMESAGGDLGYHQTIFISKDSVYTMTFVAAKGNKETSYREKTNPAKWDSLVKMTDLNDFENAKSGVSQQPADGIDNTLLVNTNRREISKMDASENRTFDRVSNYMRKSWADNKP